MDPAMGNWSENQVFKIPVSHLSLPLWTSIPSSFPWTEQDALLAKKKEFLNYLCFLFERILWDWENSCCWSWDSMSLGWLPSLELRYPKIWGNGCYWIWDTPRLGSFLLWELGEGGSCGSGSPHGFQVGCGVDRQVQQYLRHSQHCSRCSEEGTRLAQEGVVARGFGLGQRQSVHETPETQPKTSTLHLSFQMQLWLSAGLKICLGHHQWMFFQREIVRNSFSPIKIHHRFNFIPVYPFNT